VPGISAWREMLLDRRAAMIDDVKMFLIFMMQVFKIFKYTNYTNKLNASFFVIFF
jgi:hypothetical protein